MDRARPAARVGHALIAPPGALGNVASTVGSHDLDPGIAGLRQRILQRIQFVEQGQLRLGEFAIGLGLADLARQGAHEFLLTRVVRQFVLGLVDLGAVWRRYGLRFERQSFLVGGFVGSPRRFASSSSRRSLSSGRIFRSAFSTALRRAACSGVCVVIVNVLVLKPPVVQQPLGIPVRSMRPLDAAQINQSQ